jgi:hypothetical protein
VQIDYNVVHLRNSLVQLSVLLQLNYEEVVQIIELRRFGGAPNGYPFTTLCITSNFHNGMSIDDSLSTISQYQTSGLPDWWASSGSKGMGAGRARVGEGSIGPRPVWWHPSSPLSCGEGESAVGWLGAALLVVILSKSYPHNYWATQWWKWLMGRRFSSTCVSQRRPAYTRVDPQRWTSKQGFGSFAVGWRGPDGRQGSRAVRDALSSLPQRSISRKWRCTMFACTIDEQRVAPSADGRCAHVYSLVA